MKSSNTELQYPLSHEKREKTKYHPEHMQAEFDTARHGATPSGDQPIGGKLGTQSAYHIQIHQRKQGGTIQNRKYSEDKTSAIRRAHQA